LNPGGHSFVFLNVSINKKPLSFSEAPCVSIVVASNENNRGGNTDVLKNLPNLDGSKDDISRPPQC
jgi:hypothetical protein